MRWALASGHRVSGRWNVPGLHANGFYLGGIELPLPHLAVVVLQVIAFWTKVVMLGFLQIAIRWTLPRLRYDQLMRLGWQGMLPASLANVIITAIIVMVRIRPYRDVPADYYPARFRGEHRLMHREDKTVRCVSCMMCATVCPADCIHIVAGDAGSDEARKDKRAPKEANEKYPVRFEIDELRCVVCGFCVEACPCDAIRMDTGRHVPARSSRNELLFDRTHLLASSAASVAVQGGEGPGWRARAEAPKK